MWLHVELAVNKITLHYFDFIEWAVFEFFWKFYSVFFTYLLVSSQNRLQTQTILPLNHNNWTISGIKAIKFCSLIKSGRQLLYPKKKKKLKNCFIGFTSPPKMVLYASATFFKKKSTESSGHICNFFLGMPYSPSLLVPACSGNIFFVRQLFFSELAQSLEQRILLLAAFTAAYKMLVCHCYP